MNSVKFKWKAVLVASVLIGIPIISTNALAIPIINYKDSSTHAKSAAGNEIYHWYAGTNLGLMQPSTRRKVMTVPNGSDYPPPGNVDQYSLNQPQTFMLDVQAGYRWNRDENWIPSYALALRYEHIFPKDITGTVTQYSDSEFKNYSYTWGMSTDVISLYYKLDLVRLCRFMFYVDMGLGVSFDQSHGYHETALPDVIARLSPDYASKTSKHFAYNVGAGVDFILSKNLIMSAGYSHQSLGNPSSGFGQGPNWGDAQLKLGELKTNMGFIGISYLIK